MKKIKTYFQYLLLAATSMVMLSAASPVPSTASAACRERVFTFPTWYKGVVNSSCDVEITELNDFWVIVMNLIEILLQAVVYVAAGYVVWGGFKYIKSEGEPSKITESKSAIMNGIIGLVIALASVAIVDYIQGLIKQS